MNIERFLPRSVKRDEISEGVLSLKHSEKKIEQDFDMSAVRIGEPNIFDERDFFEDIPGFIPLVESAIDDGKSKGIAVAKQKYDRHFKKGDSQRA